MSGSPQRFVGKTALVTGAAQGLGRAVARRFAQEGARLVLFDIEADPLAATVAELRRSGTEVEPVVGDVSERAQIRSAVEVAERRFGKLDIAVQVAGITDFVPFVDVTDESWDRILGVNLRGTWYLVQESARAMIRGGTGGAMVVTSSTNAFQPEVGGLCYNTSKAGQISIMQTAAMELAEHGIRVNAVAPGIMKTRLAAFVTEHPENAQPFLDRIPMRRFADPAEVAAPIVWMCSDDASYLTGELMIVDGAMTVGLPLPGDVNAPAPA